MKLLTDLLICSFFSFCTWVRGSHSLPQYLKPETWKSFPISKKPSYLALYIFKLHLESYSLSLHCQHYFSAIDLYYLYKWQRKPPNLFPRLGPQTALLIMLMMKISCLLPSHSPFQKHQILQNATRILHSSFFRNVFKRNWRWFIEKYTTGIKKQMKKEKEDVVRERTED